MCVRIRIFSILNSNFKCAYCGLTIAPKKKNTAFTGGHMIAAKSSILKKYTAFSGGHMPAAIKKTSFYRQPLLILPAAKKKIKSTFNGAQKAAAKKLDLQRHPFLLLPATDGRH